MDIQELIQYPRKIRVVKGAFQESINIAMKKSKELNKRCLSIIDKLIQVNHPVWIATHDAWLIQEMEKRQYFKRNNVEIEMLNGVSLERLNQLKNKGYTCKVYLTYGKEWYFYHRLAEYPENLYVAVTDISHVFSLDSIELIEVIFRVACELFFELDSLLIVY